MSDIFDTLIRTSDNWARKLLTHQKVSVVGYNDREESTFEDSTKTTTTFYAQEGEVPDYNSDKKFKREGVVNIELKVFKAPSNIEFNEFITDGVRDRITIDDKVYEIFSVDTDRFWGHKSTMIFLQPLV